MTESVVADFVARCRVNGSGHSNPVKGRIVMSPQRLVLALDDGNLDIPLDHVVDIGVGRVSEEVSDFFDDTISITFDDGAQSRTATIEGEQETMEKFGMVLFKTLLNGTAAFLIHPASVGGYGSMTAPRAARLRIEDRSAGFDFEDDQTAKIVVERVTGISSHRREFEGKERPVLSVRHLLDGTPITTDIAMDSGRKLTLLNRFLRLDFDQRLREIGDYSLEDEELDALAAIYSDGQIALGSVLETGDVEDVLDTLQSYGLVESKDRNDDVHDDVFDPTLLGRTLLSARREEVFN